MGRPTAVAMRGLVAGAALLCALLTAGAAAAAPVGTVSEYSSGIPLKAEPWGITAGADGNVWFTETGYETTPPGIARITPEGVVKQVVTLPEFKGPEGITAGPEGNLWFTEDTGAIVRITPSGTIKEFTEGLSPGAYPDTITTGPEGNMWFTEYSGRIGRITPAGAITEFPLAPEWKEEDPLGVAVGPEGDVWFAEAGHYSIAKKEQLGGGIGRLTPSTGVINEYPVVAGSRPNGMALGPDGNMWFSYATAKVGRITPAGTIKNFTEGISPGAEPSGIAAGADGNLWFAEYAGNRIGRITPEGKVTEFSAGVSSSSPRAIAAGPDGNLWFAQLEGYESPAEVGSIVSGAAPALLAAPVVSGGGVAGTPQQCAAAQWSTWSGLQPASSLFAVDGYRFMLDGAPVGSEQSYTPPASSAGHSLTCSETVTYGLQGVTASATSASVTVSAPAPAPSHPAAAAPPVLSHLGESSSRWREGSRPAAISRRHGPPIGTVYTLSLNEAASVRVTFTQIVGGRSVGGRCVAPTHGNSHLRPCRRTVIRGALVLAGHAGSDHIRFQGRLSRSRKLSPGSYAATFQALNASGQRSQQLSLRFTIVP